MQIIMSMRCELTGKSFQTGNNVSHAKNRTKRRFKPNLQKVKIRDENGTVKRVWVSAKALRSGKVVKA